MRDALLGDVWRIEEIKGEGIDERLVVSDICVLDNNLWLATIENSKGECSCSGLFKGGNKPDSFGYRE
ncbi:hypothetical protein BFP72_04530 [Reichenbachiella sp. 5M10]|uniref:hypothetical protein n=1 Tax=Reichenbachiella sp. 5M10 TaxID=1889772 RepID=UPI000C153E7D|nr:hypothetical protein [Reichenbachiella sp. 5M10]PIB34725.1 hypothetical protein BFP72_04530 [Reichenbachiella sp. 5M10]